MSKAKVDLKRRSLSPVTPASLGEVVGDLYLDSVPTGIQVRVSLGFEALHDIYLSDSYAETREAEYKIVAYGTLARSR